MPRTAKTSKGRQSAAANSEAKIRPDGPDKFYCTRCTRIFLRQKGNFHSSQSPLYAANNRYLTVCNDCVDEIYHNYFVALGDEKSAVRRVCLKFDIYWSERIWQMVLQSTSARTPVATYIQKAGLTSFRGRTFDDTLDEERELHAISGGISITETAGVVDKNPEDILVSGEIVDFWGAGLAPSFYQELEKRFSYWYGEDVDRYSLDVGECALVKQICMLEVSIIKDTAAGKSVEKQVAQLNALIGSINRKPVQKQKELDASVEQTPLGVWVQRYENERPLPETDPMFKDVDRIRKYVTVWYFGHLCHMLKIKNTYAKAYEDEIAAMHIERPQYDDVDDEDMLNDIFSIVELQEGGDVDE